MIDPRASVHQEALLGPGVQVGPFSIIDAKVEIGEGTKIWPHVVIRGPTRIGRNNQIYSFCSIGEDPQDKKFEPGSNSRLEIGDRNTIREYVSINRGTPAGGGATRIGNDNWVMASCHVAHDCVLGDHVVLANNATLAGHVVIEDHVTLGGFTGVHQFCRVGAYSFTGITSVIVKDVPPFIIAAGQTAKAYGLNRVGLKRHGFSSQDMDSLRAAYRTLYREGLTLATALERLDQMAQDSAVVQQLAEFIKKSERGIVR